MDLSEIKDKLEQAYNDENWNIIEELIETLSYSVEINVHLYFSISRIDMLINIQISLTR